MIGETIGQYVITSMLGKGGMGTVYKAADPILERYVALKILNSNLLEHPHFIERFKREAKNQAQLNHPNIVQVYGFVEDNGLLGIVMEYVDGETLEKRIEREGKLSINTSVYILKQVLTGISYAHQKKFIHRDLKPSNIIITAESFVKIMDFGISKDLLDRTDITNPGLKIGTLLYMSPEQIKAEPPSIQNDIYSLGIIFYEMLSGKNPFEKETEHEITEAHFKKNPEKLSDLLPDFPLKGNRIIEKTLDKKAEKRYKNSLEFIEDLTSLEKYVLTKGRVEKRKSFFKIKYFFIGFFILLILSISAYIILNEVESLWENETRENNEDSMVNYSGKIFNNSEWNVKSISSASLNSIYFINEKRGFICGENGSLFISTDAGSSWDSVSSLNFNVNFTDVYFHDDARGFLIGEKGLLLITIDSGKTWTKQESYTNYSLLNMFFYDELRGFICGSNSTILKTTDGGKNWDNIHSKKDNLFYDISFINSKTGFCASRNGELYKTTDEGNTWFFDKRLSENYIRDIYFINEEIGITAGGSGEIFRTSDSGETWKLINSGVKSGLTKIKFIDNKNGYIISSRGEILYTFDAGISWTEAKRNIFLPLSDIEVIAGKILITDAKGNLISGKIEK